MYKAIDTGVGIDALSDVFRWSVEFQEDVRMIIQLPVLLRCSRQGVRGSTSSVSWWIGYVGHDNQRSSGVFDR